MVRILVACVLLAGVAGCGLGSDDGEQIAVKLVQDYKPTAAGTTLVQMVAEQLPGGQWTVSKTSESLFRVSYKVSVSDREKELLFGVSINKHHVMALNREALAFTNPH